MNSKSPRVAIILICLLALFQVIRIAAYLIVKEVQAGITPVEWMFPAMMDIFVGIAAIFITIGLWKGKGLTIWTSTIIFFVLSISDHLDAITTVLNTQGPLPAMMSGPISGTVIQLTVMSLVEAFAIWGLTRKKLRDYYLAT